MIPTLPRIDPQITTVWGVTGRTRVAEINLGNASRGAIIVIPDTSTLPAELTDVMNALAEQGYSSAAADLTHGESSDAELVADITALVTKLNGDGWAHDQIGVIGHGAGGHAALGAAMLFELGAAVSVSAHSLAAAPLASAQRVRTPWLGLFGRFSAGDNDRASELRARAIAHVSIVNYDLGVDLYRESNSWHDHAAVFDAWQRTVEWLNVRIRPSATATEKGSSTKP